MFRGKAAGPLASCSQALCAWAVLALAVALACARPAAPQEAPTRSVRAAVLREMEKHAATLGRSVVAAVFRSLKTGEEAVIEPDRELPAAGLATIPIVVAAYAAASAGEVDLEAQTSAGRPLRAELERMIANADLAAADRVLALLGRDRVNGMCRDLELKQTVLRGSLAEAPAEGAGNVTSARDIAALLTIIASGELGAQATEDILALLQKHKSGDKIPRELPQNVPVAHVAGSQSQPMVESDAAIVFAPTGPYVLTVIVVGEDPPEAARQCIAQMSLAVYQAVAGEAN